ncbi:MAG: STAS domain-containing protein [bacterium]
MNASNLFKWELNEQDGVTVIKPLCKEITFKNSKDFHERVKEVVAERDAPRIVLDFSEVDILDSLSLGILVAISKHVNQKGGKIVIASISTPVRELFSLLNFSNVFRCFDTAEEAVEHI